MSPLASRRPLSQAGLDLRTSFVRGLDFDESPVNLFRRGDDGSGASPMPMMLEVVVLVTALILLLVILMGISWWFRKSRNSTSSSTSTLKTPKTPKTPISPRRRLSLQEKKLKIQTLPKIRIEAPRKSDDFTLTVGSEDSDEMVEIHAPAPPASVVIRRPTIITDTQQLPPSSYLSSPVGGHNHHSSRTTSPVVSTVSRGAALPSFYSVSGDPPRSPEFTDPFADPHSDEEGQLSPVPL